jgi:quercetin dioxygenase-like cupin family protein
MTDTTVKKVNSGHSPTGSLGQKYLTCGTNVSMRLWDEQPGEKTFEPTSRDYETVGYVIRGRAELELEDQKIKLEPGDSWLVPKDAVHRYNIMEPFTAIEATAPPARVDSRDES